MAKFSEGYVDRLTVPEGERDIQVFDDDLPSFGIRKFASGKASYFVKYRLGAKQRKLTLGPVVRGNLAEMRKLASRVFAKARLGQDAVAEKRAAIGEGKTMGDLVDAYLAERKSDLKSRTHLEVTRHLKTHWKPLHKFRVKVINRQDIVRVIDDLAEENGKATADRARSALSTFFAWTIDRNYRDDNPTMTIKARWSNPGKSRVLSDAELIEIWQACLDYDYGRIVKLLMLTLQRRSEISDVSASEIDRTARQILLPEARTKNGRPHIVPLSDLAWKVLESVERREYRDLLFGMREGGFSGFSKAKSELDDRISLARKEAGIEKQMPPWTLHDLRRSGSTHLHEKGIAQPHIVEAILNHVSGHQSGVAGVYNKALYLSERREALQRWGSHLQKQLDALAKSEDRRSS
jgi:integrase